MAVLDALESKGYFASPTRKRAPARLPRGGVALFGADRERCASFDQVILPAHLALNADHRPIGSLYVGLAVQRHPDRRAGRRIASNDLNTGNGLTPRPLTNRLKAFLPESPVA